MKKILAFLLAALMLCAMFVVPSSAAGEAYINAKLEAKIVEGSAPKADGKVGATEYGLFPALTYSKDKAQFTCPDDHDDYNDWDFDFYITWDKNKLYMAWVVKSDVHNPLPKATFNSDGSIASNVWPEDGSSLGYMWMHSFMQFIITPGAPENGKTNYDANYLEVGLCELADGDVGRVAWAYPKGVSADDISINDWEAAVKRDNGAKTTTYEVAIPWEMSGVAAAGTDAQFGLSFAVGAQEFYNTKKGIIEWNDAILGGKAPNKAGIITLKGGNVEVKPVAPVLVDGVVPEEANGKVQLVIDHINKTIAGEDVSLQLDKNTPINTNWAYALLLAPVEGKKDVYSIVAGKHGEGSEVTFDEYADGMIILGLHSDGQTEADAETKTGYWEKVAAMNLPVGTELTLWGVDLAKSQHIYANAMFYAADVPADFMTNVGDTSGDESSEAESSEIEESSEVEESSEEESKEESKTSAPESSEADDEGGFPVWAIILIIVLVVAVVAVVVIVVLKKKA